MSYSRYKVLKILLYVLGKLELDGFDGVGREQKTGNENQKPAVLFQARYRRTILSE